MGLISRVSSRTYRYVMLSLFLYKHWPLASQPRSFHEHCTQLKNSSHEKLETQLNNLKILQTLKKVDTALGQENSFTTPTKLQNQDFTPPEFRLSSSTLTFI